MRPPPDFHLFPYPTLFRSVGACSIARQAVRSFEPFLEPERAPDLSLLVSEVVTNGVRHAETSTDDPMVVELLLGERSEEHTSELQSRQYLVCCLLIEKNNQ